ncbi:imidazole glycerol phosphate synthase subunit HisF [Marinithermofilum abyssi]|uniref:Imidazole glycerol phosphate synthase subunit HisF n=1 Tax=Marinithermofilum abyssi TaxID=1571185 RepID=A0A8J2VFU7_9BACL|nr:imidazole glycerol phosphate synthase subunit HisF [Marinithermofilum abyssi]GGE04254.1 imidazole glycerol phosphate synthase subunit HisF [Marinithermofilum abyssi]
MITKRIIPCLDVKDGRVVKGVSFVNLRDAGDPVELASVYDQAGADELVFLDISASVEGRKTMVEVVREAAGTLTIPFTVGGGIGSVEDMFALLRAGADKVSINTSAIRQPELVEAGARRFGSQCIVVAIDARFDEEEKEWFVYTHGGRKRTDWKAVDWAKRAVELGAGEILLTSMDQDGQKNGFDLELTRRVASQVRVPVIASGGAGAAEHFLDVFTQTPAEAALAASIFHYREVPVEEVKQFLYDQGVHVRWKSASTRQK